MVNLLNKIKKELDTLEQSLIRSFNILEEVDSSHYSKCSNVAEIEIEVNGKPAVLAVGFPDMFPNVLPKFFDKNNEFGDIPHKMSNGFLCFTRTESLIIDERYPTAILLHCLEKVKSLIEDGISGKNKQDFMEEFEVYWPADSKSNIYAHIDTENLKLRELNLWQKDIEGKQLTFIAAERNQPIENVIKQVFHIEIKESNKFRCIYFPLQKGSFIKPPLNFEMWDFVTLKENIFKYLSPENKQEFHKLVRRKSENTTPGMEFIIVGLPIQHTKTILFGCILSGHSSNLTNIKKSRVIENIHPFVTKPKDITLYPKNIKRWHPDYLQNRTGGNIGLKDKHILIAGVGSVGSEVAMRFAKAGVKKVSIVDIDFMELENIHRHALGSSSVFKIYKNFGLMENPKAWALEEEIKKKYPFTEVKSYLDDIKQVLEGGLLNKERIDLIVVAIGSVNIEKIINRILHKESDPPPTIYTWVEPLGIGGHTLVTLNGDKSGCYQCLFKEKEETALYNRSAFAKPFQEFSKTLTGCGSVFTPYNFLDSERSALMTVDAGIKVLMGQLKGNPLLSWKGEATLFIENGYETTPRYTFSTEELFDTRYLYKNEGCRVCSAEGSDTH
ncbi:MULTISPECIES: ThiF family adenylyltransferase [Bacillus cereus group]|uniref:ThiF family adenylyltransferase n=1 Tax=Bacillus cereus group TaxID=86661 RepID=UPI001C72B9C8|nr:ThiF family adenylyltransferase [Bacillus toyonensis]MBX0351294.1 ThiF family adenylyltransferase [Bacillus toyonensis]MDA2027099.1 ThiF family adenylyltransferase [Bacillus cereus group sp. Bcc03]